MNNYDMPLLISVAVHFGAVVKPMDSASNVIQAWVRAEGGTPKPSDTPNDLLRRLAVARGVRVVSGDSNTQIFQRMANLPAGYNKWHCLEKLLSM